VAQVQGLNKENVSGFFDILVKAADENDTDTLRIFNVDELGFATVQKRAGKYPVKCMDCHRQYVGQTGRNFKTRYKEHIRDIRNSRKTSGYVQHIVETGHSFGKMNDIMEIKIEQKGSYLNTLENFHIFKLFKQGIQLNNIGSNIHNPIFNVIQNLAS
jgi:hypothetical protein